MESADTDLGLGPNHYHPGPDYLCSVNGVISGYGDGSPDRAIDGPSDPLRGRRLRRLGHDVRLPLSTILQLAQA